MAKVYDHLTDRLKRFILEQHVFFVGSAPLDAKGSVNVSPKGMDSLRIIDDQTVGYLDYLGSGVESIAHIKENGRFVMMFCSFAENPLIVRLHGSARVIERHASDWAQYSQHFPESKMARSIILLSIRRIADSCGWGVPKYEYLGDRPQYGNYESAADDEKLRQLQVDHNLKSIDKLDGLRQPTL